MSALPPSLRRALARALRHARRRSALGTLLGGAPIVAGLAALAAAFENRAALVATTTVALALLTVLAWQRARRYDDRWLLRQLDDASPAHEDSAGLAFSPETPRTPLQQLQQARVRARIEAWLADPARPRPAPPMPGTSIRVGIATGLLLIALALGLPQWPLRAGSSSPADEATAAGGALRVEAELTATPPAYTGLRVQTSRTLDLKAPIGSRVAWTLTPTRELGALALAFADGSRLELRRDGRVWRGERVLDASTLYHLEPRGATAADDPAHRLDAVPDAAPEIIVREPQKTLSLLAADQQRWALAFEARDDYGLGEAALTVTLAQGTGDNVKTTEQRLVLEGRGDARQRRYERTLDLAALGFAKGDDLIVRLSVADNREPEPNVASSASFILRWPPEKSSESAGMEGLVQKTLPAYFRSERQIIIDTEALIAQRGALPADRFGKQADELGVDQKVLRLRYGQFLGEGFETAAEHAPQAEGEGAEKPPPGAAESLQHRPDDGDKAVADAPVLGRAEDVLHEFGHAHDNAEAATLLDPETRRILKAALDEMWQAELHLRQAAPEQALPFEYKALDYIKQVQQAERIYLARAGLELPQTDPARRLSGKRDGLSDRTQPLPPPEPADPVIPATWDALGRGTPIDGPALRAWVRAHPAQVADALGLLAAVDRVERAPDCGDCRESLKALLWPLLPLPPSAVTPRLAPDAAGRAYLDALGSGAAEDRR